MATTLTRMGLGMGLAALLIAAGCGKPLPAPQAKVPAEAQALGLDGPGLNDEPTLRITVPARPMSRPHEVRRGNWARLHTSSAETLPALKALINGAQRSLWFETFNFGNDSMGQQVYQALIARARAGVEVKVVMDYVGSKFLPKHGEMIKAMRAAGIEVRLYAPRLIMKDDQKRGVNIDHRKVYIADGERAMAGGVNLMKPFDTHTQDVLVEWRGPIVGDLATEWAYDWKAAGGKPVAVPPAPPAQPDGWVAARVAVTSPAEGRFEARDAIYAGLDSARHEIRISNQYLWDDRLIARLYAALERGVKVRIVVPGDEDHGPYKALHAEELKKLIERGAQARLFVGSHPEAHLHTKYFGADDAWVAIGSANGDTRALMDNQELDTVIYDPKIGADFRDRMFQRDWTEWSKPFVYVPGGPMTKPFRTLLEIIDYYL